MKEKKVSTLFEQMRDDVNNYINNTLQLGKLEAYDKLSLGSATMIFGFAFAAVAVIALFFILLTVGFYLAELLGSYWQGFAIVAGFSILVLLVLLLLKKSIKLHITNSVVSFLMKKDDDDVQIK
ncbi:MAG: phage holin family protein [Fermentimonas sp.]|jgi:predicted permease